MGSILMRLSWESIHARLTALDNALRERANAYGERGGVGHMRNVWHNALLARQDGRPWSGVDYAAVRAAVRIDRKREYVRGALQSRLWAAWERAGAAENERLLHERVEYDAAHGGDFA